MSDITQHTAQRVYQLIDQLDAGAPAVPPPLRGHYMSLRQRADAVRHVMGGAAAVADENEMGAIPFLIPMVIVGGGAAATYVAKLWKDKGELDAASEVYRDAREAGASPDSAARAANAVLGGGWSNAPGWQTMLMGGGVLLGVWLITRMFK